MNQEQQHGIGCVEFEVLLAEAVEGALGEGQMQSFRAHAAACTACTKLLAEATAGYRQIRSLEQIELPPTLIHNILAATTGVEPASAPTEARVRQSWIQRSQSWLRRATVPLLQPRVAGAFAMAFFSITLMLSLAGINPLQMDLHPSAIRDGITRTYFSTKSRVIRYYDSMRIVYDLQAGVQELRSLLPEENTQPQAPPKQQEKKDKSNKDISVQPQPEERQRNENYAQHSGHAQLASYRFSRSSPPYFMFERNRRRTA